MLFLLRELLLVYELHSKHFLCRTLSPILLKEFRVYCSTFLNFCLRKLYYYHIF